VPRIIEVHRHLRCFIMDQYPNLIVIGSEVPPTATIARGYCRRVSTRAQTP
jgi:hypothetical protein